MVRIAFYLFSYELNEQIDWSGGIDLRSYKAEHYMEVTDLLGGDYAIDKNDKRNDYDANPQLAVKTCWRQSVLL